MCVAKCEHEGIEHGNPKHASMCTHMDFSLEVVTETCIAEAGVNVS